MGDVFDLDAATREAAGDAPTIVLGGEKFEFPVEIAFEDIAELANPDLAKIREALSSMLGDQAAAFWAHRPTISQINALFEHLVHAYGFGDAGESPASNGSSANTSRRSRPTSVASTD